MQSKKWKREDFDLIFVIYYVVDTFMRSSNDHVIYISVIYQRARNCRREISLSLSLKISYIHWMKVKWNYYENQLKIMNFSLILLWNELKNIITHPQKQDKSWNIIYLIQEIFIKSWYIEMKILILFIIAKVIYFNLS